MRERRGRRKAEGLGGVHSILRQLVGGTHQVVGISEPMNAPVCDGGGEDALSRRERAMHIIE
ncbi:hypothetical protein Adi01nite_56040 [Amorphoplanes digitatis]|nr:hypothetical protein Adi01nite_56040 [Actinoplanes digitatis]